MFGRKGMSMTTHGLVDPELAPLLDMVRPSEFTVEALPAIRAELEARVSEALGTVSDAKVKVRLVPEVMGGSRFRSHSSARCAIHDFDMIADARVTRQAQRDVRDALPPMLAAH